MLELRKTVLSDLDGTNHIIWVICRKHNGENYYFNYAYDEADRQMALVVLGNMRESRDAGDRLPSFDVATDLAYNFVNVKKVIGIAKRTSQRKHWYITRKLS